jgi:tRNA A37 threonylcarbamoyladenosine biosynthesis protein TsaE
MSIDEAVMLDIDEMLASGPLVVEWADQIEEALPKEGLWIHLRMIDEEQRDMLLSARGKRYHELLSLIRRRLFGVA